MTNKQLALDLDLLRRYEPVVRYTQGELFFPCAVDGYLQRAALWLADAEHKPTLEAKRGTLTTAVLGDFPPAPRNHLHFLQFVETPLDALAYRRWSRRPDRPVLDHRSRLQRIGLVTRVLDGGFDASLLVRGRVPGGTTAAAEIAYSALQADDPRRVYYGRVVRVGGYIVLHYFFFFVMNDWRSSFQGVNDHESDWEQILIYLSDEGDAPPQPRWVAYASHDFSGDDLRRRWDDPEVEKVNHMHPVIYAGAGSHASYFQAGEYLMQVEPRSFVALHELGAAFDRFWTDTLRQGTALNIETGIRTLSSIPFVDYARGDGRAIGPEQAEAWTPLLISDADGWVDNYRGLWGLDTRDPLGGERAPSGPKYNRDGSIRLSWRDPLAWAGLDKVPPPGAAIPALHHFLADLAVKQSALAADVDAQRIAVRQLELELGTLRSAQYLSSELSLRTADLRKAADDLQAAGLRLTAMDETRAAALNYLARLEAGDFGPARAHIQHAHIPPAAIKTALAAGPVVVGNQRRPHSAADYRAGLLPAAQLGHLVNYGDNAFRRTGCCGTRSPGRLSRPLDHCPDLPHHGNSDLSLLGIGNRFCAHLFNYRHDAR